MFSLTLTGEPKSTNHLYRSVCRGRFPTTYLTPEGKKLKQDYRYEVLAQWRGRSKLEGDVVLTIRYYFKNKRRRDLDNQQKLVLDALNGTVFLDDSQIEELHLYRCYDAARPRVEIDVH